MRWHLPNGNSTNHCIRLDRDEAHVESRYSRSPFRSVRCSHVGWAPTRRKSSSGHRPDGICRRRLFVSMYLFLISFLSTQARIFHLSRDLVFSATSSMEGSWTSASPGKNSSVSMSQLLLESTSHRKYLTRCDIRFGVWKVGSRNSPWTGLKASGLYSFQNVHP